jgi:hypothetical protein
MIAPSQLPSLTIAKTPPRLGAPLARMPRRRLDPAGDVAIRFAGARDAAALGELEQLDGHSLAGGAHLLAELGGVPVAAIAVADDTVVADPFARTAGVVDLLRVRARQLRIAA